MTGESHVESHANHTTPELLSVEQSLGYLYFVMFALGISANILAIAIFLDFSMCSGKKRLVSTTLFLHLATADLLCCAVVFSFSGFAFLGDTHSWEHDVFTFLCNASGTVFNVCSRQTVNIIAIVSFGRCTAVLYPFKHAVWFTKGRIYVVLGVTWTTTIILSCLIFISGGEYRFNDSVTLCTWTLDDIFFSPNSTLSFPPTRPARSALYFITVLTPILLPVLVTVLCLGSMIIFFRRSTTNRFLVRASLADMAEISEGFAQAVQQMLDTRDKIKQRAKKVGKMIAETGEQGRARFSRVEMDNYYRVLVPIDTCPELQCVEENIGSGKEEAKTCQKSPTPSQKQTFAPSQNQTLPPSLSKTQPDIESPCSSTHSPPNNPPITETRSSLIQRAGAVLRSLKSPSSTTRCSRTRAVMDTQTHAFITLLIIGSLFVFCYSTWIFLFVCGFIATLTPSGQLDIFTSADPDVLKATMMVAILLINLNSVLTPCIHITRGNSLKNRLRKRNLWSKAPGRGV
eukprot:sb/3463912/